MGTGVALSDRFKGLKPWKLLSVEEEFGPTPALTSFNDILGTRTLEITINRGSKTSVGRKNVSTTCLHKLFSRKPTGKEGKAEKLSNLVTCKARGNKKEDQHDLQKFTKFEVVAKKNVKTSNIKGDTNGTVPKKTDIPNNSVPKRTEIPNTTLPKKADVPKVSMNQAQSVRTPITQRPRDPRLLYGKGSYSISKGTAATPVPEKLVKSIQKKSFEEAINTEKDEAAPEKKNEAGKTIQVLKRNAVTKKVTGVVQLNVKRKPLLTADPNKPHYLGYVSNSAAGTNISERDESNGNTTKTPLPSCAESPEKPLKGILKKSTSSILPQPLESNDKIGKSAVHSVKNSEGTELNNKSKTENATKEPNVDANKLVRSFTKQSENAAKAKKAKKGKAGSKASKRTVKRSQGPVPIVFKLSIIPSIDNGQLNWKVVSSSEEDQQASVSTTPKSMKNLEISVEHDTNPAEVPKLKIATTEGSKTVAINKLSPVEVHMSRSDANELLQNTQSVHPIIDVPSSTAATKSSEGSDISSANFNPCQEQISKSNCVYTMASSSQVMSHQSIMQFHGKPHVPITQTYARTSNASSVQMSSELDPFQAELTTQLHEVPVVHGGITTQHIDYQGKKVWPSQYIVTSTQPVAEYGNLMISRSETISVPTTGLQTAGQNQRDVHAAYLDACEPSITDALSSRSTDQSLSLASDIGKDNEKTILSPQDVGPACKPLHSTISQVSTASVKGKSTGADNHEVVDMEITSSPCHVLSEISKQNVIISESMQTDQCNKIGVVHHPLAEDSGVNISQAPCVTKALEGESISDESHKASELHNLTKSLTCTSEEAACLNHDSNPSPTDVQNSNSWATYMQEDTNSPMKSAFGCKQSFSEALSLLRNTMSEEAAVEQRLDLESEVSSNVFHGKESQETGEQGGWMARAFNKTSTKDILEVQAGVVSKSATDSIQQSDAVVKKNSTQLDDTLSHGSDVPDVSHNAANKSDTSDISVLMGENHHDHSIAEDGSYSTGTAQDSHSHHDTSHKNLSLLQEEQFASGEIISKQHPVTEEENDLSLPVVMSRDQDNSKVISQEEAKPCAMPQNEDISNQTNNNVNINCSKAHYGMLLRRTSSPGTPVEDEVQTIDSISSQQGVPWNEMGSKTRTCADIFEKGQLSSLSCDEENNNSFDEISVNVHDQSNNSLSPMGQRNGSIREKYGAYRYPDLPERKQKLGRPVYMRDMSNVSDISISEDELGCMENHPNQDALEPLLVRGTGRQMQELDEFDNFRYKERSLREPYDRERAYNDRNLPMHMSKEFGPHPREPSKRDIGRFDNTPRDYFHPHPTDRNTGMEMSARPAYSYKAECHPEYKNYKESRTLGASEHSSRYGNDFCREQTHPVMFEQLTALQALQLQINAAVNPAHRAALLMALQALTACQMQPFSEAQPSDYKSAAVMERSDPPVMSEQLSSQRVRDDDSQGEDPNPMKVEFTVVVNEKEAEELLRRDALKRQRTEDHGKVTRYSYEDDRFAESSNQYRQDFHRRGYHDFEPQVKYSGHHDVTLLYKQKETATGVGLNKGFQINNSEPREYLTIDHKTEKQAMNKRGQKSTSPDGRLSKRKKSPSKKSRKRFKEFHGRPLIKDKTNSTNPHPIPLQSDSEIDKGNDPRRSLTPDPTQSGPELRPLKWTSSDENSKPVKVKSLKHKHKGKKHQLKSVVFVKCACPVEGKQEGSGNMKLPGYKMSFGEPKYTNKDELISQQKALHTEGVASVSKIQSMEKETDASGIASNKASDTCRPNTLVQQSIETLVTEARIASSQVNESNTKSGGHDIHNDREGLCNTSELIHPKEQMKEIAKCADHLSLEQSDTSKFDAEDSLECKPNSFSQGLKSIDTKKDDSPEHSRKHRQNKNDQTESPHRRTPSWRQSPDRARRYKSSDEEKEERRYSSKRKYYSDSDSDREHSQEPASKVRRQRHFSRFPRGQDWRRGPAFRRNNVWRQRTPNFRFQYRRNIYSGNLGKPYGNHRGMYRGRGGSRGSFRGKSFYNSPYQRKTQSHDNTRDGEESPRITMANLGFKSVVAWDDIHVALSEVKSQMMAVEHSPKEVRLASALLQVAPLQKARNSTESALRTIYKDVNELFSKDKREVYLHRRKYEILMADIRIHAEVIGKLLPPDQKESLLSGFVDNVTGIPNVEPAIELKVLSWLRHIAFSAMLSGCKDLLVNKMRKLRYDAFKRRCRGSSRSDSGSKSPTRLQHQSDSQRSPDSTQPDSRDQDLCQDSSAIVSCPELGFSSPETPGPLHRPKTQSEIRQSTEDRRQKTCSELETCPSIVFRDPPQPARKLLSTSEENLQLLDICLAANSSNIVMFDSADSFPNKANRAKEKDQSPKDCPSGNIVAVSRVADSSSVSTNPKIKACGASELPVCHSEEDRGRGMCVPCDSVTSPKGNKTFWTSPQTYGCANSPGKPNILMYSARVQRLASQTLMSHDPPPAEQAVLQHKPEKMSRQSVSPTSSEVPTNQSEQRNESSATSPKYSRKSHILQKFQDGSRRFEPFKLKKLKPLKKTKLNLMYDEDKESCAEEPSNLEAQKVHKSPGLSAQPAVNSQAGQISSQEKGSKESV